MCTEAQGRALVQRFRGQPEAGEVPSLAGMEDWLECSVSQGCAHWQRKSGQSLGDRSPLCVMLGLGLTTFGTEEINPGQPEPVELRTVRAEGIAPS